MIWGVWQGGRLLGKNTVDCWNYDVDCRVSSVFATLPRKDGWAVRTKAILPYWRLCVRKSERLSQEVASSFEQRATTWTASVRSDSAAIHGCILILMTDKQPTVYILASKPNGTIYVGVTSNLSNRITAHKTNAVLSFTQKYGVHILVHMEAFETIDEAILREKQLKAGSRQKKIALIEKNNPGWVDISGGL